MKPDNTETRSPPADFAPMRIGEHAALDFLNSVVAPSGETFDFCYDGDALMRWLEGVKIASATAIATTQSLTPKQRDRLAADMRSLREWFRQLVLRWSAVGVRAIRATDIAHLNALMAQSPTVEVLEREPEGVVLRAQPIRAGTSALLGQIATICAELLAQQPFENVRKCENPACTVLFADNKRGSVRRWCSMSVCGNRMKVAAHRARQRSAESASDQRSGP
ncbi:MAG: ABATE domain-containing protein [Casimicrobium sp.]